MLMWIWNSYAPDLSEHNHRNKTCTYFFQLTSTSMWSIPGCDDSMSFKASIRSSSSPLKTGDRGEESFSGDGRLLADGLETFKSEIKMMIMVSIWYLPQNLVSCIIWFTVCLKQKTITAYLDFKQGLKSIFFVLIWKLNATVTCKSCEAPQDLRGQCGRVAFYFPMKTKNMDFYPYIYTCRWNRPSKHFSLLQLFY